ncbi:hypothetical protein BLOT_006958 [Blomia tropicalis]|nr:hypothetical protein BLOT_006958 [Blomia tropicalis]
MFENEFCSVACSCLIFACRFIQIFNLLLLKLFLLSSSNDRFIVFHVDMIWNQTCDANFNVKMRTENVNSAVETIKFVGNNFS